jgi:hypothetical protein
MKDGRRADRVITTEVFSVVIVIAVAVLGFAKGHSTRGRQ